MQLDTENMYDHCIPFFYEPFFGVHKYTIHDSYFPRKLACFGFYEIFLTFTYNMIILLKNREISRWGLSEKFWRMILWPKRTMFY